MKSAIALLLLGIFFIGCKCTKHCSAKSGLSRAEILAKYTWQVNELWTNTSGNNVHYLRGVENTTEYNQDIVRLTFNLDGTGTHTDATGIVHQTTWSFSSDDETNLDLTINGITTDHWNLVDITEKHILESAARASVLISARWEPVQ
ncbi:hypothetical protein ACQ33O_11605 [Ferruginibacter sp. SUN002]|uniref:hypothetical protein n=1 Tax=Ferruginibacter sp. SUN002 TaxID=2937789 RepID=UPI003D36E0F4